MKRCVTSKILVLSILFLLSGRWVKAQDLRIFRLDFIEDNPETTIVFSSFSDVYRLSAHPDSAALPDTLLDFNAPIYMELTDSYRWRFLDGVGLKESDFLYAYNYEIDSLLSFRIKDMKVIAVLNAYSRGGKDRHEPYEYKIGLQLDIEDLYELGPFYNNVLVCTGKTSPFSKGKMQRIQWEKDEENRFPEHYPTITLEDRLAPLESGTVYSYFLDGYRYYLRDKWLEGRIVARHLLVVDEKSNFESIVLNRILFEGESASFQPLNGMSGDDETYQWTGRLFKDRPPVILGFLYESFGCERIDFLQKGEPSNYIHCDNRH